HLVRALRPRLEADDVAHAQLALEPLLSQHRRAVDDDEPLLHPVVEVVRPGLLVLAEVVQGGAEPRRAEEPPHRRRTPAVAGAHLAVRPVLGIHPKQVHATHRENKHNPPPVSTLAAIVFAFAGIHVGTHQILKIGYAPAWSPNAERIAFVT